MASGERCINDEREGPGERKGANVTIGEITQRRNESELKLLHDTQQSVEKLRIQVGNRVAALVRGVDQAARPEPAFLDRALEALVQLEKDFDAEIGRAVQQYPIWDHWLGHVRGIGPGLAGQMMALLLPPLEDRGPSTWFRAAGLYPQEWEGVLRLPRARSGEGKITYHPGLRRCLFNVGTSFVKMGRYYRVVYDQHKMRLFELHLPASARCLRELRQISPAGQVAWIEERYGADGVARFVKGTRAAEDDADAEDDELPGPANNGATEPRRVDYGAAVGITQEMAENWPLLRVDRVARWAMLKLFLSHLWEKWLEVEGKPSRVPYVVEKLGHHYIPPPEWDGKHKM